MATFSARARAYITDLVITALFIMAGLTLLELVTPSRQPGKYVVWLAMITLLLYEPVLVNRCGGTLGHRAQGLVVVGPDGSYLAFWTAVVRTALKWLTIMFFGPFTLRMGRRQALWDLLVESMVCERRALALTNCCRSRVQSAPARPTSPSPPRYAPDRGRRAA